MWHALKQSAEPPLLVATTTIPGIRTRLPRSRTNVPDRAPNERCAGSNSYRLTNPPWSGPSVPSAPDAPRQSKTRAGFGRDNGHALRHRASAPALTRSQLRSKNSAPAPAIEKRVKQTQFPSVRPSFRQFLITTAHLSDAKEQYFAILAAALPQCCHCVFAYRIKSDRYESRRPACFGI